MSRLRFTPAEDKYNFNWPIIFSCLLTLLARLLALGLEKYGMANYDSIQRDLLPTKTTAQLANRVKNMTASRAIDNPIKVCVAV